jgi:hypothetical protein
MKGFWGKTLIGITFIIGCSLFVPQSSVQAASLRGKNNEEKIFYYLMENVDFNNAASAGVLANIEKESSFRTNAESDNGTSYGICQWHGARYENLKRYCRREGYDYKELEGQLEYLKSELEGDYYYRNSVLEPLKGVSNDKKGAYNAGYRWCYYFEIPADKETRAEQRGDLAKTVYYPRYKDIVLKLTPGQKYKTDEGTFIALTENTVCFKKVADKKAAVLNVPNTVTIGDIKAKVTEIASGACKGNKKLTTVTIGKNVTKIGKNAFYKCKNLTSINIKSKKIAEFGPGCFAKINKKAVFKINKKVIKTYKAVLKEMTPDGVKFKKG